MALTVQELEEKGVINELAAVFGTREEALYLLGSVELATSGLDTGRLPSFGSGPAVLYWREVGRLLERGLVREQGLEKMMAAAARLYPGNAKFKPFAASAAPPPAQPPAVAQTDKRTCTLLVELDPGALDDKAMIALFMSMCEIARSNGKTLRLDMVSKGSIRFHVSLEGATGEEAQAIAQQIRTALSSVRAQVHREDHNFRDYFMDPLFAEGPDGQRFELLDHVRASTRVKDIAQGVVSQYDDAFWPTEKTGQQASPTVDVRRPDGEVRRVQTSQTLHDAGVRPHDTLAVYPERRAGGVNPFLRAESLTIVRNQILDFARSQPGFEVEANSTDIPTEYLFRFRAPGFAPGTPPTPIDRHEVLLVMPPEFPVKAPQAYWQHDVFHPNIHEASGLVCLGVLADSYRPGLHFGILCQMLIDMVSFRNYALTEGYNEAAARWAASDEGQRAILAIGGRSREEVLGLDNPPARRVSIRKVGP